MSKELKLCPFCGGHASYDRVGTNRQSCIVICEDCGCMVESNETGEYCGNKWNIRQESQAQSKALTVDIDFLQIGGIWWYHYYKNDVLMISGKVKIVERLENTIL